MRRRLLIVAVGLAALLVFGGVAAYAYEAARDPVVPDGVTVAGLDLGGMTAGEARAKLRDATVRLDEPIIVRARTGTASVVPDAVHLRVDVEETVAEALRTAGNPLRRAVRDVFGFGVQAAVPLEVSYSGAALSAQLGRIERRLERPARNARLVFPGGRLKVVPARKGVALDRGELEPVLAAALVDPTADRVVHARTDVTRPKVTRDRLAAKYDWFITVNRPETKLRLYRHLKPAEAYTIAVGQIGLETPAGLYHIETKAVNPPWHVPERPWAGDLAGTVIPAGSPDNPIKARWMGFHDGAGIHGTDDVASLGEAASHGCIRMSIPDVIHLYERVQIGTPVYVY